MQENELGLRFDQIIVPNGSSGMHAGLSAGLASQRDDPSRVHSYTVFAPLPAARSTTLDLAQRTLALLSPHKTVGLHQIEVDGGQLGEGYGVPTQAMVEAVELMARHEGLLLDPVYSGKAFAGLIAAIRSGEFKSEHSVLFVMTGGTPGLFAYEPAFRD